MSGVIKGVVFADCLIVASIAGASGLHYGVSIYGALCVMGAAVHAYAACRVMGMQP